MTPLMRWLLLAILVLGAGLRIQSARHPRLEVIEQYEFMPGALSLAPDYLPLRMSQHGAETMYLIRLSTMLFGRSTFGFRALSVVAGTATIFVLFLIAHRWWGPSAGLIAAGLLSIERFHVTVSGRAIDLPFNLLLGSLALYAFARFLEREQLRWLYVTAVAIAAGFLCRELTGLMLPAIALSLLLIRPQWVRSPHPWLAAGLFAILIAPDLYASITTTPADREVMRERHVAAAHSLGTTMTQSWYDQGLFMSHADQLSRFHNLGLTKEPFYFYFGSILNRVFSTQRNIGSEFPFVHPAMGFLLWVCLGLAVLRPTEDRATTCCLILFVVLFLPFAVVQLGQPRGNFPTDARAMWYWVDQSILPALLLTGRLVGRRFRPSRGRV